MKCPFCHGTGEYKKERIGDKKREEVKRLIAAKVPYSKIAKHLKIKSVSTVHYYAHT